MADTVVRVVNNRVVVAVAGAIALWPQVYQAEAARDASIQAAADAAMVSGVDTARRASLATAKSQPVAASIQTLKIDHYAPTYADGATLAGESSWVRMSKADIDAAGLPALAYFRHDTDRGLPDLTTDATNGGYFVLNEPIVSPTMMGAKGDGIADDTAPVSAAMELERPIDLQGKAYVVTGLTPSISTLRMRNGRLKLADGAGIPILAPVGQDVVGDIEGVTFDGNYLGQPAFIDQTVVFQAVRSLRVSGCRFYNGSGAVLAAMSIKLNMVVEGCLFAGGMPHTGIGNQNTLYLFARLDPAFQTEEPQFFRVAGNTFVGIPTGGVGQPAVGYGVAGMAVSSNSAATAIQGHKVAITDNLFYRCGQTALDNRVGAITLYRRGPFTRIANNVVLFGDERGIDVQASENVTVTGNVVYQTLSDGIATQQRGDSGVIKNSAKLVITDNTVIGDGIAPAAEANLRAGIRTTGHDTTAGANDIIVSDNLVSGYPQMLVMTGCAGSLKVADNIFDNGTSTFTAATQRPIAILSDSTVSTEINAGRLSFTGNQISNQAGPAIIRGYSLPVIISDNTWGAMSTSAAVLGLSYCSGVVSVNDNIFQNNGAAIRIDQVTGTLMVNGNTVLNTNGVIRAFDFRTNTADILVANNIFKTAANPVINFNTCSGQNKVSNNIGPVGATIATTSATVSTNDNMGFV